MNGAENGPAVQVRDLVKRFGSFTAVDHVSFEVAPGEIFGFLGPNGAGKSTTIKMLNGLLTPTSGLGLVLGYDMARQGGAIKASIGYMSQKFSLYDDLSVAENINFFGGVYGLGGASLQERRRWALDLAGLTGQQRRLTRDLPGGVKQRLALACAALHGPRLLFLDEPTAGVDPRGRRLFWEFIYSLADQGVTIFVTTHYMDEAEYCHRLAMIMAGRLAAVGTPEELKRRHGPTGLVAVDCEDPLAALAELKGDERVEEATLFGLTIHAAVDDQRPEEVVRAILAAHDRQARVAAVAPSLEDVFIRLARSAGGKPGGPA